MSELRAAHEQHLACNLLDLIVMPTESCNFRCTYCYERFERGPMAPWVVRALKRFLSRRAPELDLLVLSWFGGEPLLATDIVTEVQSHARSLARDHSALQLHASMTTNGFLLDPNRLVRLLDLGVRQFQISFDGPREVHDRKRVRVGGQGTFERLWDNLLAARRIVGEFEIIVRVHLDEDSRETIPRFLEDYRGAFGADPRFTLFMRPLARLGGSRDDRLKILARDRANRVIKEARDGAQRLKLKQAFYEKDQVVCHAATANCFVVRSDGTLGKCAVALSHDRNRVGRLLPDGRVALDDTKMKQWMRGLFSGDPGELACPMRGYADPRQAANGLAPSVDRLRS